MAWQTLALTGYLPARHEEEWSDMCSPVRCRTCGKITWSGCGDHVDEIKAMVPDELWCEGHDTDEQTEPLFV